MSSRNIEYFFSHCFVMTYNLVSRDKPANLWFRCCLPLSLPLHPGEMKMNLLGWKCFRIIVIFGILEDILQQLKCLTNCIILNKMLECITHCTMYRKSFIHCQGCIIISVGDYLLFPLVMLEVSDKSDYVVLFFKIPFYDG